MKIQLVQADYLNEQHRQHIPYLLNEYALDPMGGGEALNEAVKENLVARLSELPHAFSVIPYVDDKPAGLANCFEGFSTFACQPLVNIHDMCVLPPYRGLGLSQRLLEKVESIAQAKGCCKLTLEVLTNNTAAKSAYEKFGFSSYELDPEAGNAVFWQKKLAR